MRYIFIFFVLFFNSLSVWGEPDRKVKESTVKSYDDYILLRYFPSRSAFLKSDPVVVLKGAVNTIVLKKDNTEINANNEIEKFYQEIKAISDKGIISNQRFFHVAINSIEVSYKGDVIEL